jgi:neopullulanase
MEARMPLTTRFLTVAMVALAFVACEQSPDSYDYHGASSDVAKFDLGETELDISVPDEDQVEPPSDLVDTDDTTEMEDMDEADGEPEDSQPADSWEEPDPVCGDMQFTYAADPGVQEVLLSGSFNEWGDSAASATVMVDEDGDSIFEATLHLEPGTYQYKFVVDGEWILDPANPSQADDGEGNINSLITVPPCPQPGALTLEDHKTNEFGDFTARFKAPPGEVPDEDEVLVTVDHEAVQNLVSVVGNKVEVAVEGLAKGIHDVRVIVGDEVYLLKVYVGISTDWRETILYFVMTDRFVNGDQSNDGPLDDVDWRTNYQGGDFAGVTQKLKAGYFDDLGVGAIWLSWPVDNPGGFHDGGRPSEHYCGMDGKTAPMEGTRYTGFHGYWPSDLYKTEEHFGTMEELQELVNTAHAHGIRILLDFTANHVHESSPFYQEHKDDGFFHFPAEICQDVGWDTKAVTCWFTSYLPDLNYSNPAAVKAVLDYAMFWAKETGSDGFRLDAVKHIEMDFVSALRARAKEEMELTGVDFYIVGETFTGDAGQIKEFISPTRIHGQFDFPTNWNVLKAFATNEIGLDEMDGAVRTAKGTYGPEALMSNFVGNHDIARFVSLASGAVSCGIWDVVSNIAQGWLFPPEKSGDDDAYRRLKLAFTYIMTIPGIPLIYYGDEFGMPGAGDPDNRRMMYFGSDLSGNEKNTLDFMQQLGASRREHPALAKGEWGPPLWSEGDFLAYARTFEGDRVVILLNRGYDPKSGQIDLTETLIPGGTVLTDVFGGSSVTIDQNLQFAFTIPGRTAAIYAQ